MAAPVASTSVIGSAVITTHRTGSAVPDRVVKAAAQAPRRWRRRAARRSGRGAAPARRALGVALGVVVALETVDPHELGAVGPPRPPHEVRAATRPTASPMPRITPNTATPAKATTLRPELALPHRAQADDAVDLDQLRWPPRSRSRPGSASAGCGTGRAARRAGRRRCSAATTPVTWVWAPGVLGHRRPRRAGADREALEEARSPRWPRRARRAPGWSPPSAVRSRTCARGRSCRRRTRWRCRPPRRRGRQLGPGRRRDRRATGSPCGQHADEAMPSSARPKNVTTRIAPITAMQDAGNLGATRRSDEDRRRETPGRGPARWGSSAVDARPRRTDAKLADDVRRRRPRSRTAWGAG